MKIRILLFLVMSIVSSIHARRSKIVGLMQIRNESPVIEQALHALSFYTDAIVILDDASHDNTVSVCQSLADRYHIEHIICNETSAWEHGTKMTIVKSCLRQEGL